MPTIGNPQIKLLERLCSASAVSGDEAEVRRIVIESIKGLVDEYQVDALGNVLAVKKAPRSGCPRVMLAAHMDEVGFMLVAEDGAGLYRFETVGGMDVRQLVGKRVLVGKDHLPGIIGARPIHLTTAEERRRSIPLDALRIDLGPEGKASLGDRAVFDTRFRRSGPAIIARALDNRLGVVILIELLRSAPENIELLAAFTAQEELGGRGARVAAFHWNPDMAIAVDSTPAHDLPTWDDEENASYNTRIGLGPAVYVGDGATLSDPRLVRHFTASGDAHRIPYQIRQPGVGGTDAAAIQRQLAGIPVISISTPHRYSHTAASIARLDDWKNSLAFIHAGLSAITPDLLKQDR